MTALRIEGLEAAISPDRLYPVETHSNYGFFAGLAADARQILAGVDEFVLLIGIFDAKGNVIDSRYRDLQRDDEVAVVLNAEFGWESALVRVKRFRFTYRNGNKQNPLQLALVGVDGFAITPFPRDWEQSIADSIALGEEREDFEGMVRGWIERGNFALYWGNEYHLDNNGRVVGS